MPEPPPEEEKAATPPVELKPRPEPTIRLVLPDRPGDDEDPWRLVKGHIALYFHASDVDPQNQHAECKVRFRMWLSNAKLALTAENVEKVSDLYNESWAAFAQTRKDEHLYAKLRAWFMELRDNKWTREEAEASLLSILNPTRWFYAIRRLFRGWFSGSAPKPLPFGVEDVSHLEATDHTAWLDAFRDAYFSLSMGSWAMDYYG